MKGYGMIVNYITLKTFVKVVYLEKDGEKSYAILLSTEGIDGKDIIKYFQLRHHIESLIRDAKRFGGLEYSKARDNKKLNSSLICHLKEYVLKNTECGQRLKTRWMLHFHYTMLNKFFQ